MLEEHCLSQRFLSSGFQTYKYSEATFESDSVIVWVKTDGKERSGQAVPNTSLILNVPFCSFHFFPLVPSEEGDEGRGGRALTETLKNSVTPASELSWVECMWSHSSPFYIRPQDLSSRTAAVRSVSFISLFLILQELFCCFSNEFPSIFQCNDCVIT